MFLLNFEYRESVCLINLLIFGHIDYLCTHALFLSVSVKVCHIIIYYKSIYSLQILIIISVFFSVIRF